MSPLSRAGSWITAALCSVARQFGGVKARMALVLGIVLLLPTIYAGVQTWRAWEHDQGRRLNELGRTAQLLAAYEAQSPIEPERLSGGLAAVLPGLPLPAGAAVWLVDHDGVTLAASDAPRLSVPPAHHIRELMVQPDSRLELTDSDGRRWTLIAALLRTADGRADRGIVVGLPRPPWGWLGWELTLGVLVPTLMLALAVLAIWIATDFVVNRHVVALAGAAERYGRGTPTAPLQLAGAPLEIQKLGSALEAMDERVREREAALQASLEQKTQLLREIHHRIKNNLQIVTSLLNLRAQRERSPATKAALAEAQLRIRALALVHRHLYEHEEVRAVAFAPVLRELAELIEDSMGPQDFRLEVHADEITVTADQAITLALFVTEALSNAFLHAFPADWPIGQEAPANGSSLARRVWLRLDRQAERIRLEIGDNGVGLPFDEPTGLGFTLMGMLARQLSGRISRERVTPGTRISLDFPGRATNFEGNRPA